VIKKLKQKKTEKAVSVKTHGFFCFGGVVGGCFGEVYSGGCWQ
jgi:H+/Cl- antiporter ClcA